MHKITYLMNKINTLHVKTTSYFAYYLVLQELRTLYNSIKTKSHSRFRLIIFYSINNPSK